MPGTGSVLASFPTSPFLQNRVFTCFLWLLRDSLWIQTHLPLCLDRGTSMLLYSLPMTPALSVPPDHRASMTGSILQLDDRVVLRPSWLLALNCWVYLISRIQIPNRMAPFRYKLTCKFFSFRWLWTPNLAHGHIADFLDGFFLSAPYPPIVASFICALG